LTYLPTPLIKRLTAFIIDATVVIVIILAIIWPFDSIRYGRIPKSENVPYIECNATINDKRDRLSIMIINKHFTDNLSLNLEIKNFNPSQKGDIIELNSQSPFDYNTIENRNKIQIQEKDIVSINSNMTIELTAHSVTVLKLTKK